MKKLSYLIFVAFAAILLVGCSKTPSTDSATPPPQAAEKLAPTVATDPAPIKAPARPKVVPPSAPRLITIKSFSFRPASLTISKGETVKWVNNDGVMHTVTSDTFQSNVLQSGNFFTYQFDKIGNYPYSCKFHPDMKGNIIVQ